MQDFLGELAWRGLLADHTPGLSQRLTQGTITGYVGFDPTARSLQIGNLVPVMLLAHLQRAGGKPLVVIGGGTGLIGDPSGRSSERPLLDETAVLENVARQRRQFERFLEFGSGPHDAELVDNAEWLKPLGLVGFLRDVGKHFTVGYMLQKESVKSRLETGISYTEFSYMLLQAYDFLHLYRTRKCELQLGGSDQWGNITAGVELIRRATGGAAHGVAAPLVTTTAGAKFGKTEEGAVWLAPELTSPWTFFQFWLNADDRDVEGYLKVFTFKMREEIDELIEAHRSDPGARVPHRALAHELTSRVHGAATADRVGEGARILFGDLDPFQTSAETWSLLYSALEHSEAHELTIADLPITAFDLVWRQGFHRSKSELRRKFKEGAISINGRRMAPDAPLEEQDLLPGGYFWVRRGKKTDAVVRVSGG
jgi:tyrosyl-tRNA synthetase